MISKNTTGLNFSVLTLGASLLAAGCTVDDNASGDKAVATVNSNYNRTSSTVLIRKISVPTLANLDYAAYSKNVMLYDTSMPEIVLKDKIRLEKLDFGGILTSVVDELSATPLTEKETDKVMSWAPVLDHLLKWNFEIGAGLANAYSTISGQKWGDESDVSRPFQELANVYIHSEGNLREVWVELEFKPWMAGNLEGISDQTQDGFPDVYAKISSKYFTPQMIAELESDYSSKPLNEEQVRDWANTLAAYWYPSYNTDVLDLSGTTEWPFVDTEEAVKKELADVAAKYPISIFKGRPFRDPIYNVFIVEGMGVRTASAKGNVGVAGNKKVDENLLDHLEGIKENANALVAEHGSESWDVWRAKLTPFHSLIDTLAASQPPEIMGLLGQEKFLIFRRELEYLKSGDLALVHEDKNPIPAIVAFKDKMSALGIDFLFVPIPTKQDIYPEIISSAYEAVPGNIPQPYFYKLLGDLAQAGVETVDLLTPFLESKEAAEEGKRLLYQFQDTHWTTVGIELAAQVVSDRIQGYNWFGQKYVNLVEYKTNDTLFENLGDIHARLAADKKGSFGPEKLLGRQVILPDGAKYVDNESSSILVLGDSYTGVYQSVGCKHAGVTAHMARNLGGPVDLIMGWGGGPEAPGKLEKRGDEYLNSKRLVVWLMTTRDLFAYSGSWKKTD